MDETKNNDTCPSRRQRGIKKIRETQRKSRRVSMCNLKAA